MKHHPYSKSFASRLTWRIILVLIVMLSGTFGLIFYISHAALKVEETNHYESFLNITNERVGHVLTVVEVVAKNNRPDIEKNLSNPDKLYGILEQFLKLNPYITGCGIGFTANYYPQRGRWFEPYVARRAHGRFESAQIGSATHDYMQAEWFVQTFQEGHEHWSVPYFDDKGANQIICTYSLPIRNSEGKLVAVFGVDLSLDWLKEFVDQVSWLDKNDSIHFSSGNSDVHSFIIGRDGTFIVHPDSTLVLKSRFQDYVKQTSDTLDNVICREMMEGKKGFVGKIDVKGISSYIAFGPIGQTGWSMGIVVPDVLFSLMSYIVIFITMLVLIITLPLIFFVCYITIRHSTSPLKHLALSSNEVARGYFETPLPVIKSNDEIQKLRDSFEAMQHSLSVYIDELKKTTAQKASIESELKIAHDIQMNMLPKEFPPFPERTDIDIYGQVTPAKAVGGDLFDFFIRDEKLFFCIGDVSGKGVPASLVMAVTRALFRTASSHEVHPDVIVSAINSSVSEENDSSMFVTLFVGVLDLSSGQLSYCNAGHDSPLLIGSDVSILPCDSNLPNGVMPDWHFSLQQIALAPHTTIFLYTDGLNEAEDCKHSQFGDDRIVRIAEASLAKGQADPHALISNMTKAVHQFVGAAEQSDDLTMLAIRYE